VEEGMIDFFYADPHFGHKEIIEYERRPFADRNEMNAELMWRYNAVVEPEHTCLWAGDAFLKMDPEEFQAILASLNGKKILILGNHDRSAKRMAELGFVVADGEVVLSMGGRAVRVSHYPYWTGDADRHGREDKELTPAQIERYQAKYPCRRKGEVLLHGHIHGNRRRNGNMINIGVDAWAYAPVSWAEVEELVRMV
jgi:calcineurin-like phosphoesterase family protein